ncbi:unnamed protein product [Symbiodinium sp. CCMP2592]|nr:unnamed protein product [Symbiodinium sp. CCMP2592]
MPRGSKRNDNRGAYNDDYGNSATWEYWRGGWSPRSAAQAPWKPRGQGDRLFPAFDEVAVPAGGKAPEKPAEVIHIGDCGDDQLVSAVQAALNAARKAEQRVAKLKAQGATVTTKWEHYEAKLKETYQKEHDRYQAARERLQRELHDAEALQFQARQVVRQAMANKASGSADVPMLTRPTADQVFAGWLAEEDNQLHAVLNRALGVPHGGTPMRGRTGTPLTPPGHLLPPAGSGAAPPYDPYMQAGEPHLPSNPGPSAPFPTPGPAGEPGAPPPGLGPMDTGAHGVASPGGVVDHAYGPSPNQERAIRRRALEPFGIPTTRPEHVPAGGVLPAPVNFLADDEDEAGTGT